MLPSIFDRAIERKSRSGVKIIQIMRVSCCLQFLCRLPQKKTPGPGPLVQSGFGVFQEVVYLPLPLSRHLEIILTFISSTWNVQCSFLILTWMATSGSSYNRNNLLLHFTRYLPATLTGSKILLRTQPTKVVIFCSSS